MDHHEVERAAARAAARAVFLEQLDREEKLIEDGEHPLIDATLRQLTAEKDRRLKKLAEVLEEKEQEYERYRDASTEQAWRQWAVSCYTLLGTLRESSADVSLACRTRRRLCARRST